MFQLFVRASFLLTTANTAETNVRVYRFYIRSQKRTTLRLTAHNKGSHSSLGSPKHSYQKKAVTLRQNTRFVWLHARLLLVVSNNTNRIGNLPSDRVALIQAILCVKISRQLWMAVSSFLGSHQHALAKVWTRNVTAVRRPPKSLSHETKFSCQS